jgi:hypothetical protein
MQMLSSVAIADYVIADWVSNSFATVPMFLVFAAFAFRMNPEKRRPALGAARRPAGNELP